MFKRNRRKNMSNENSEKRKALEMALKELGFQCKVDLSKTFLSYLH